MKRDILELVIWATLLLVLIPAADANEPKVQSFECEIGGIITFYEDDCISLLTILGIKEFSPITNLTDFELDLKSYQKMQLTVRITMEVTLEPTGTYKIRIRKIDRNIILRRRIIPSLPSFETAAGTKHFSGFFYLGVDDRQNKEYF